MTERTSKMDPAPYPTLQVVPLVLAILGRFGGQEFQKIQQTPTNSLRHAKESQNAQCSILNPTGIAFEHQSRPPGACDSGPIRRAKYPKTLASDHELPEAPEDVSN